jgi:hypothetical protein
VRVCYFYTKTWDEAVEALPSDAEQVYVGGGFTDYWEAISSRWGSDDLMVVEHDIMIHDEVLRQFEECPNVWCTFPYWKNEWFDNALGCTRFRLEVQQEISPQEIQEESWGSCWECNPHATLPTHDELLDLTKWRARVQGGEILGCWRHIDGKIIWSMQRHNIKACVHLPTVEHLSYRVIPDGEFYVRSWE